jgi:hypothetical protein
MFSILFRTIWPYSFSSQYEVDSYNLEAEIYNNEMRVYSDCMSEYVENAKNDLVRIKEKANEAISEASSQ